MRVSDRAPHRPVEAGFGIESEGTSFDGTFQQMDRPSHVSKLFIETPRIDAFDGDPSVPARVARHSNGVGKNRVHRAGRNSHSEQITFAFWWAPHRGR